MPPSRPATTAATEHPWDPYGPGLFVIVGQREAARHYKVPVSMINHYSGYFRVQTSWPYIELTDDDVVRLPGEDPEIFQRMLQYLDCRQITWYYEHPLDLSFDTIIDIYGLGIRRDVPLIQNVATDLFANKIKELQLLPDRWSVEYLWERCPPGCALRILLVELVRAMWIPDRHKDPVWNQLAGGESPTPDRLIDMMETLESSDHKIRVGWQMKARLKNCGFHEHDDGEHCEQDDECMLGAGRRADDDMEYAPHLQRGGRGPHRGINHPSESPSYIFD
ncbi:hypothetical protein Slin15195_G053940 [Septoria linicola]|uniref:BTB domain-containing protein n=1 Tax=Septoria linicola TaxID=215465 RepID=A0A9Q9AT49_9PEZI|nr:hypothetical protein Slin14017_G124730 [Septoria linicola]USW52075.1 hypothetical protein Slin15195_G053940 [Septoria linicola]